MSEQSGYYYENQAITLVDVVSVLWRYRRMIFGFTVGAGIVIVAFAAVTMFLPPEQSLWPDYFRPEALVLVAGDESSPSFGQNSSGVAGNLAALAGIESVVGASYGDLAVELATSRSVFDRIAQELDVAEHFEINENVNTNVRRALRDATDVKYDEKTALLTVAFEDPDAEFATEVVNLLVSLLNQRFRTIGGNRAITRRDMLEEKVSEVQRRIAELEGEIIAFTEQHGIIDVRTVTQEQAQTMANLRSDLILKEMEIETYSQVSRVDDPVLQRLRAERANLRELLRQMEEGSASMEGVLPSQQEIPQLAFEYERLQRNLSVQSQIYQSLASELELARLNAEGQEPVLQNIELAQVPELEAGPARLIISFIVTITAFFFAVFVAFLRQYVTTVRSDPREMAKFHGDRRQQSRSSASQQR